MLHLLKVPVNFAGALFNLPLARFERCFEPIEPDQIRLILGLVLFERLPLGSQLFLANLQIVRRLGGLRLQILLARRQRFALCFELLLQPVMLSRACIDFKLARSGFFLLGIDLAFAILDFSSRAVDRFMQSRQPVAAVAVALIKFQANAGQFLADIFKLFLP